MVSGRSKLLKVPAKSELMIALLFLSLSAIDARDDLQILAKMATERSQLLKVPAKSVWWLFYFYLYRLLFIFISVNCWCSRWSPDTSQNGDRALKAAQCSSQTGFMIAFHFYLCQLLILEMATERSKLLKVPAKSIWCLFFIFISFIIILAYFYCAAYTGMKVIESPTNCDRRCIMKLINSHRRVWIDGFSDAIWKFECP